MGIQAYLDQRDGDLSNQRHKNPPSLRSLLPTSIHQHTICIYRQANGACKSILHGSAGQAESAPDLAQQLLRSGLLFPRTLISSPQSDQSRHFLRNNQDGRSSSLLRIPAQQQPQCVRQGWPPQELPRRCAAFCCTRQTGGDGLPYAAIGCTSGLNQDNLFAIICLSGMYRLLDKVPNKQRPIGTERHILGGLSEPWQIVHIHFHI